MDSLGWKAQIGIVVPSTNTIVQPECEALRPAGVTNHVSRAHIRERKISGEKEYMEHVAAMRAGIGDAIDRVMTSQPQHLVMGIALEAFWGGVEGAAKLEKELSERSGVGVSMGSNATRAALEAFGARRIAVLTPHQPRGDEMVRLFLEEAGFEIVRLKSLRCASPRAIAQVKAEDVRAAYAELDGDNVDALLQVGTNLAGMAVAAEVEKTVGKPVLSMNVITYWHALRALGIEDPIAGYGRILEEF
ncbi:Asp/Glu racemase [Novosphingobium sp. PC22D]|uniref:maleate cis-trans isomerase family protein n=1 Tax=Novosphingobium sp. PC22D TaxID=1962403 RepID=UPI000BEF8D7D|nr:Asp/Glu racemase [Novosphingobium sp. PC22D]PEQ11356.1 Asp/Glu racemase [Novosphingobium sp. PC22D]